MIWQLFVSFFKVGVFAFGGGYAMMPLLQRELVDLRHWLSSARFLDVVALSQMTPGPLAINAATFVGIRQAGIWGSAVATVAVVLPSVVIVWLLARLANRLADSAWLQAGLEGLRPLVVVLIVAAALGTVRESLPDWKSLGLAVGGGLAVGRFRLHPLVAMVGAGLLNWLLTVLLTR